MIYVTYGNGSWRIRDLKPLFPKLQYKHIVNKVSRYKKFHLLKKSGLYSYSLDRIGLLKYVDR